MAFRFNESLEGSTLLLAAATLTFVAIAHAGLR
jgi:hypothetical protein